MTTLEHLVVGVDGSECAHRALEWAAAQAGNRLLTVVHGFSPGLELWAAAAQINLDPVRAEHHELLDTTWSEPARAADHAKVRTVLVDDNPASALLDIAERESADAIVIGHQGHSRWSRHHVGDIAGRLLHHCDRPLILTGDSTEPHTITGTVVVGLSRPTDPTNAELRWALQLADGLDLEVHLVSLIAPQTFIDATYLYDSDRIRSEFDRQMKTLFGEIREAFPAAKVSSEVRHGDATRELAAAAAEHDAGVVVIGSHHPATVTGFAAGSVARLLPPVLNCPVVVVPGS